jgi:hypothetical protein
MGGLDWFEFYLLDATGQEPPPDTSFMITQDGEQMLTQDNPNMITEG